MNMQSCGKKMNLFDSLKTTPPVSEVKGTGEIEITIQTNGLRRRVKATRISGCTVYWEE
ncbi:hypothetical protein ACNCLY_004685 [Escherichia coli]